MQETYILSGKNTLVLLNNYHSAGVYSVSMALKTERIINPNYFLNMSRERSTIYRSNSYGNSWANRNAWKRIEYSQWSIEFNKYYF